MVVTSHKSEGLYGRETTIFQASIRAITKFGHNIVNLPDFNGQVDGDVSFVVPRSGDLVMGSLFHIVIPGICNDNGAVLCATVFLVL